MANETPITVVGNLTADPELRYSPSGAPVANFTVAVTPRTFDRQANEWKDGETAFYRCSVWREAAENVAGSLRKGMRVIATGALRIRGYETKDGEKRTAVEINVDEIGPSLRFANAAVTRSTNTGANGPGWGNSAPQTGAYGVPQSNTQQNTQGAPGGAWGAPQGAQGGGWGAPQGGQQNNAGGWGQPGNNEPPF